MLRRWIEVGFGVRGPGSDVDTPAIVQSDARLEEIAEPTNRGTRQRVCSRSGMLTTWLTRANPSSTDGETDLGLGVTLALIMLGVTVPGGLLGVAIA